MKKMRRLIPAVAMLMVAAVMLSTASFAWFTMNTAVSASGMQIQAKADSSLVISEDPLTFDTGKPSVDFGVTTAAKLYPMTYGKYGASNTEGWVVPSNTTGINTATGIMVAGDTYKSAGITTGDNGNAGNYYVEKEVYIASAGAAMTNKKLTITLTAPVSSIGSAAKAYAAAIYVIKDSAEDADAWANDGTVAVDAKPTAVVYVDQAKDSANGYADGRHTVTLPNTYNIPSIVGVGEQDQATTGIKVIIRFYVDGDLTSVGDDKVTITKDYEYKTATGVYSDAVIYYVATDKYNKVETPVEADIAKYYVKNDNGYTLAGTFAENTTYYVKEAAYVQAIVPETMKNNDALPTGWFVREPITDSVNYKYIRTDDVPGTGTELEITFTTSD